MPLTVEKEEFDAFYDKVRSKFPFKEIRSTRSKLHPKWPLLKSSVPAGILFHSGHLHPILASTMEPDAVQHLIISRQAIPLPPDFSMVLDSMDHWGRRVDPHWCHKTLELFEHCLKMEDLDRTMLTSRQLHFDTIQIRVLQKLGDHFSTNVEAKNEGFNAWVEHFNTHVCRKCHANDFFGMAVASFQHISDLIMDVINGDYGPASDSDDDSDPGTAAMFSEMALPDAIASNQSIN